MTQHLNLLLAADGSVVSLKGKTAELLAWQASVEKSLAGADYAQTPGNQLTEPRKKKKQKQVASALQTPTPK